MTRLSVLYVDDDRSNLLAIQYALGDALDLQIAESGDEALELAEGVDVLVADQRMPGMSGVEVCRLFRKHHPRAARILYTAYADAHAGVAAINDGGVSHLLVKPVVNEDLLAAILDSHETKQHSRAAVVAALAASAPSRVRRSLGLAIGRSMSEVMSALYDHAVDRDGERDLRAQVVSLQAGATMTPLDLTTLAATGIPVTGSAVAALDLDSLLHALVLVEPRAIELHEEGDHARIVLRTHNSVARDTIRVALALLERGGGLVAARDGDLVISTSRERNPQHVRIPRLRPASLDLLIVGDHAAHRESFGDLSVAWTDADGAHRRVHDARVIVVDERSHDATLCHELRRRTQSTLLLRSAAPDFARHRTLAGVIDGLVHDEHNAEERHAILLDSVARERGIDTDRRTVLDGIQDGVASAMRAAFELKARLGARTEPLLTSQVLRDAWRSCESASWPSI